MAGAGGGVGASVTFNLLRGPLDCEVVMVDDRREMLLSHLWDLEQVLEQGATGTIREGSAAEAADADIVVMAASAPLTVNQSRMVYLADNAAILAPMLDLLAAGWPGILIVVTNPVDPLVAWAQRRTGLDRSRVLGYTLNDSLRLRTGIGRALGVAPGRVDAWTIGEHGDGAVPLLSRAALDGRPVTLSPERAAEILEWLRGWYARHVALDSGRSSTWTSGTGIARMVQACVADEPELWPASIVLEGEYGLRSVALSVPVQLAAGGMQEIVEWPLDDGERAALEQAAEIVRTATAALG